jgi:hypothetical protein
MTQVESPECTPACSMCSITPATRADPPEPSEVGDDVDVDLDAPSRNLSISTGAPSRSLMSRALVM